MVPMMSIRIHILMVGPRSGTVILKKQGTAPAPSIRAASYISLDMVVSPASRITI